MYVSLRVDSTHFSGERVSSHTVSMKIILIKNSIFYNQLFSNDNYIEGAQDKPQKPLNDFSRLQMLLILKEKIWVNLGG